MKYNKLTSKLIKEHLIYFPISKTIEINLKKVDSPATPKSVLLGFEKYSEDIPWKDKVLVLGGISSNYLTEERLRQDIKRSMGYLGLGENPVFYMDDLHQIWCDPIVFYLKTPINTGISMPDFYSVLCSLWECLIKKMQENSQNYMLIFKCPPALEIAPSYLGLYCEVSFLPKEYIGAYNENK